MCEKTRLYKYLYIWIINRVKSSRLSSLIGLFFSSGQYIILQGADESTFTDRSALDSDMIGEVKSEGLCFSFWYHMSDTKAGSLSVTTSVRGN